MTSGTTHCPGLSPSTATARLWPHTASSPPTKAARIRQRSQGRCARKPAGPPRPPCSGRCGGPGIKWPTRRLPSSASTTRTRRPRKPPAPPSTRHPQPGYRRRPMDPSSPALKADGLRQHVRSALQVREAPGQRRDGRVLRQRVGELQASQRRLIDFRQHQVPSQGTNRRPRSRSGCGRCSASSRR